MFRYVDEQTKALQQSSELLQDSVVSLISKVGINLRMSDENNSSDKNLNRTIFELTKDKMNNMKRLQP